jgi:hypothetical protein
MRAENPSNSSNEESSSDECERMCKICYGNDDLPELGGFMTPCKCSGTIKWVNYNYIKHLKINKITGPQTLPHYLTRQGSRNAVLPMHNVQVSN